MNKIKNLKKVKSLEGKGRAWIREALNNNLLDEYLSILITNKEITK